MRLESFPFELMDGSAVGRMSRRSGAVYHEKAKARVALLLLQRLCLDGMFEDLQRSGALFRLLAAWSMRAAGRLS